jgi:hypothetical protein
MWPFKRKQESPAEIAAEERLDEAVREDTHQYLHRQEELPLAARRNLLAGVDSCPP